MQQESWTTQQYREALARGLDDQTFRGVRVGTEDHIQANFIAWAGRNEERYPQLKLLFSIPNGAHMTKMGRWVITLTGRKKGVPDICCPIPSKEWVGLWIEFKKPGSGRVSPEQRQWMMDLTSNRQLCVVHTSWQAAANEVIKYLGLDLAEQMVPVKGMR